MQKIISLSSKDFFTGIAQGPYSPSSGLFANAVGVNPFIADYGTNYDYGLLQANASPTEIGTILGTPYALASQITGANAGKFWLITSSGHLYEVSSTSLDSPSDKRSATPITNPAKGMFIFKAAGGADKLYYIQNTQIGQWDLTSTWSTNWNDAFATGLQSTDIHPVHRFGDRVYICDLNRLSMFYDNAGTPTLSTNVLDFQPNEVATCIEDDGTYIVVGLTKNLGDATLKGSTRVVFWDTNASSWAREWMIPDAAIVSLKNIGGTLLAICTRGVYAFNFASAPKKLHSLTLATAPEYGYPNAITRMGDAALWGGRLTQVNSFGKITAEAPNAFLVPYAGLGSSSISLVSYDVNEFNLIVGTAAPKLYKYSTIAGGGTASPTTVQIDLKGLWHIKAIDVVFGRPLASGDAFDIDLKTSSAATAVDWNGVSYTFDGAINRKWMTSTTSVQADTLALVLNFTAGNVRIKRIDVYGEPVTR